MGPGPAKDLYIRSHAKTLTMPKHQPCQNIDHAKTLICNDVISSCSPTKPNPRWVFKTSLSPNDIYYRILSWLEVKRSQLKTRSARDPSIKRGSNDGNWRQTSLNNWSWTFSLAKVVECRAHNRTQRFIPAERRGKYLKYY